MLFKKADDNELLNRYTAVENGTGRVIEVGIGRMLFGYRIRAGYEDDFCYYIDWCCGANKDLLYLTQGLVMGLLKRGYKLRELPVCSRIKPWNKDEEFKAIVNRLIDTETAN